jgi:hypothetical protein
MNTAGRSSLRVLPCFPSLLRGWVIAATCVVVLATSLGASRSRADQPETRSLFDGKSLDGWKRTDFANAGAVTVEDGTIVMSAGRTMTGITSTRQDLPRSNYELSYEAIRLGGNDFFAAATFPVGKSYLTLVNGGWGGNVTGLSSLDGSDASENETGTYIKYQNKTWYRFRVRVNDDRVRCWVDDKEVIDVSLQDREVDTRIETEASKPLGFATWDTSGGVRKIEVRTLTPAEVVEARKSDG